MIIEWMAFLEYHFRRKHLREGILSGVVRLWNSLPLEIRQATLFPALKKKTQNFKNGLLIAVTLVPFICMFLFLPAGYDCYAINGF